MSRSSVLLNCITTGLRGRACGEVLIVRYCHSCECGGPIVRKHFLITVDAPLLGHVGEVVEGGGCGEKSAAGVFTRGTPTKLLQPLPYPYRVPFSICSSCVEVQWLTH